MEKTWKESKKQPVLHQVQIFAIYVEDMEGDKKTISVAPFPNGHIWREYRRKEKNPYCNKGFTFCYVTLFY